MTVAEGIWLSGVCTFRLVPLDCRSTKVLQSRLAAKDEAEFPLNEISGGRGGSCNISAITHLFLFQILHYLFSFSAQTDTLLPSVGEFLSWSRMRESKGRVVSHTDGEDSGRRG